MNGASWGHPSQPREPRRSVAEVADRLARQGVPVLPLYGVDVQRGRCLCRKWRTCSSPGKHPVGANGVKGASTDSNHVRSYFQRHPTMNIGAATGHVFDVLDLDGDEALELLQREVMDRSPEVYPGFIGDQDPVIVRTGRGWHVYFAPTGEGNRARMGGLDGVDWRGIGGYVLVPPSVHLTGHRYAAMGQARPLSSSPVAPRPLLQMLRREGPWSPASQEDVSRSLSGSERPQRPPGPSRGRWSPQGLLDRMAAATEGERNGVLYWCAGRLTLDYLQGRCTDQEYGDAMADLHVAAVRRGLGDHEVRKTIESARRGQLSR